METKAAQYGSDARFQRPVGAVEFVVGGLAQLDPSQNGQRIGCTEEIGNRFAWMRLKRLVEDCNATVDGDLPGTRRKLTRHEFEKARFPHAVATDKAGLHRAEGQVQATEKRAPFGSGPREIRQNDGCGHEYEVSGDGACRMSAVNFVSFMATTWFEDTDRTRDTTRDAGSRGGGIPPRPSFGRAISWPRNVIERRQCGFRNVFPRLPARPISAVTTTTRRRYEGLTESVRIYPKTFESGRFRLFAPSPSITTIERKIHGRKMEYGAMHNSLILRGFQSLLSA